MTKTKVGGKKTTPKKPPEPLRENITSRRDSRDNEEPTLHVYGAAIVRY